MQTVFKKETDFQIPLHNSIIFFCLQKEASVETKKWRERSKFFFSWVRDTSFFLKTMEVVLLHKSKN